MKRNRRMSFFGLRPLLLCLAMLLPVAAWGQGSQQILKLDDGSITIEADGYSQGNNKISHTGSYLIQQENAESSKGNTITVASGAHDITLQRITIEKTGDKECAFSIESGATVTLTLEGENSLQSGREKAGLHVAEKAVLTIKGKNGMNDGNTLVAKCVDGDTGRNKPTGAAVGGNRYESSCGTIIIESGTVTAIVEGRSTYGAAIGGGENGNGGTITINGGVVTASCNGDTQGAAIGGGSGGNGGSFTINGGTVTATVEGSWIYGAVIGGGKNGNGGTILLKNADMLKVSANGLIGNGNEGSVYCSAEMTKLLNSTSPGVTMNTRNSLIYDENGKGMLQGNWQEDYQDLLSGTIETPLESTLKIASGQTMTVPEDVTLNCSQLDNEGTLVNEGTASFNNRLMNKGTLTNNGTMSVKKNVTNEGTLTNNGTMNVGGSTTEISGTINGTNALIKVQDLTFPQTALTYNGKDQTLTADEGEQYKITFSKSIGEKKQPSQYTNCYGQLAEGITMLPKPLHLKKPTEPIQKEYDRNITIGGVQLELDESDIVEGESVLLDTNPILTFENNDVGKEKPIKFTNLKLQEKKQYKNYSLVVPTDWTGEITPKEIGLKKPTETITKKYDGTTAIIYVPQLDGIVWGDYDYVAVAGCPLSFADANVGEDKEIIIGDITLEGPNAGNYTVAAPTGWTGTITAKPLTLAEPTEAITKIYDGTTAVAYTPLLEGVVGEDAVSLAEGYTLAFDGADAGKHTISASNLSLAGEKAGNYTLQATTEFAGEITAKPLTHEDIEIALSTEEFTENGSRQVPDATVTDKGNALAKDKDYTVTEPEESIIPGDYLLAFTGMGNYQGSVTKPYTIVAKPAPTAYAVILTQPTGGTLTASTSSAIEGTTVALSYTENTDYDFGHWIAQDADGNTVDVADDNTFVMPAANVSITAVFNYNPPITPDPTLYTVTLPFVEGATTDPSDGPYEVEEGKDFEFTLTLNQDYNLSVPVVTTSRGETLKPLNQGTYVIEDIYDDLNIYISGIVKNPEPVANASIEADVVKVWGGNGYLYLQLGTARKVSVYTFSGSLFRCDEVPVGDTRWSLPTGNYIVRIADKSYKVIVR